MKHIAVILSGCGYLDGSEINEAVSCLIALSQTNTQYTVFAPNINYTPINHKTNEPLAQTLRNTLEESARITRGQVSDLQTLEEKQFDALLFPGGYGAAIHLSNWAQKGAQSKVHPDVERVIRAFHESSKPIGAVCIAPTLVAKVLGSHHVSLTIGNDKETAEEIKKTGAKHIDCPVDDFITDRLNKIITTPAYMYNTTPAEAFKGISAMVRELVEMA